MKNIKELLKTVGGVIASASSITGLHAYKMSLEQRAEYQRKVADKIAVRSSDHRPQKSNELLDVFDKKTNFRNDGNWPGSFKDLMDYFNNLYAQLSGEQIAALLHLSTSFLILICITSIIGIVYGDILIKYLKLEERYPRLAKFIVLRRKFQQFYLFIHFFIILMTLFALIYINIYALILL